ncbi:MAG: hypothetical protein ACTSXQ_03090 [Alphaproteobacteria bacterium]
MTLKSISKLLSDFEKNGISYCHWKSNEHLGAALEGKTDLDVLFDISQQKQLEAIFKQNEYYKCDARDFCSYPFIEDYLGVDKKTGTLIHVHTHYKMLLGEKNLKGYHLPWEKTILKTRIYDAEQKVYLSEPNIEMLLLLVRSSLKIRWRDFLKSLLGKKYFDKDTAKEYDWLLERINKKKVLALGKKLISPKSKKMLTKLLNKEPNLLRFYRFNWQLSSSFSSYKRFPVYQAKLLMLYREGRYVMGYGINKFTNMLVSKRRSLPNKEGLTVAFLGVDGSGKSTVTKRIIKDFSKKLDTTFIYFGSGDGQRSMLRGFMRVAHNTLFNKKKAINPTQAAFKKKRLKWHTILWFLEVAREKNKNLRKVLKAKKLGRLIICDRYPQSQIEGINDGPKLGILKESKSSILRKIGLFERKIYKKSDKTCPDLVIKLLPSPEVAFERKEHSFTIEMLKEKSRLVEEIAFPKKTKVVIVNADQPLETVIAECEDLIWKMLKTRK